MFAAMLDVGERAADWLWFACLCIIFCAIAVELHDNGRRINSQVLLATAWGVFFYIGWRT